MSEPVTTPLAHAVPAEWPSIEAGAELTECEAVEASTFFVDDYLDFMRDEIAREDAEADEADRQAASFERWGCDYD